MFDFFGQKEGPGVFLETPRKTGLLRFFEIFFRDLGNFYASALLCVIGLVPVVFGVALAVIAESLFWGVIFGVVGGAIASPFFSTLVDTILRAQRDEPGYWWVRYRRAFARNFKVSLLLGAIFGALLSTQVLFAFLILPQNLSTVSLGFWLFSVLLTVAFLIWAYPQIVLFNLSFFQLVRNTAILSIAQLPRTLAASLFFTAYWVAFYLLSPASMMVFLFTTAWLPTFAALSFIYVPLDKTFAVEKLIEEKRQEDAEQRPRYYSKG